MLRIRACARAFTLVALALATASCASVASGTTQLVNVVTEPSGANCTLTRGGKVIADVITTPSAVKIDKSVKDMDVTCRREDYEDTTVTVQSKHDAWGSAGNILAWGIFFPIAMGVDAASGAMNEYPESVILRLNPRSFASAEERDRYYDRLASQVESEATAAVDKIKTKCKANDGCKGDIGKVEAARDAELAALEEKRLRAVVPEFAPAAVEPAEPAATAPGATEPANTDAAPPVASADNARRQEIETKWAARIDNVKQLYCTGAQGDQAPECIEKVKLVEAQRDAELQAVATE